MCGWAIASRKPKCSRSLHRARRPRALPRDRPCEWVYSGRRPVAPDLEHPSAVPQRSVMTTNGSKLRADLVLAGGGVKGIGHVGALSVLEEHDYEIRRIAGTSAGAIVGAFAASGMSA